MPRLSRSRLLRHAALGLASTAAVTVVYAVLPPPDWHHRLSMATAYAALLLLCWSLALGPWRTLRHRPAPVSFDLRRDVSIWAGLLALIHTAVGLTVHLRGRMWMYFLRRLHPPRLQTNAFGLANDLGLIAALLFCVLLAISNDVSLRALGTRTWKRWQRWAYLAAILTAAHGILFQQVEARHLPWRAVLYLCVAAALLLQAAGAISHQRSRAARRISAPDPRKGDNPLQ